MQLSACSFAAPVGASNIEALSRALGPRARRDEPLRNYTALRVGGPADLLVTCDTVEALVGTLAAARSQSVPWLVLGGGCNVLVADAGVRGLTVVFRAAEVSFGDDAIVAGPEGISREKQSGEAVSVQAGALLAAVARGTLARGLAGLEWAAGLPGTVGGAVVGNAGAFEGDVASALISAIVLAPDGKVHEKDNDWFEFDYRTSRLKREATGSYVLLLARFALQQADPRELAAKADEILMWRRTRHPAGATMGSTFKNPLGSHAGYLIEQAGLRGHRIGGAEISDLHGNFFMNVGDATAQDVLDLIDYARAEVLLQFGVELELEIELLGW